SSPLICFHFPKKMSLFIEPLCIWVSILSTFLPQLRLNLKSSNYSFRPNNNLLSGPRKCGAKPQLFHSAVDAVGITQSSEGKFRSIVALPTISFDHRRRGLSPKAYTTRKVFTYKRIFE